MQHWLINLLLILMPLCCLSLQRVSAENGVDKSAELTPQVNSELTLLEKARNLREEQPALFGDAKGVVIIGIVPDGQGDKASLQNGDILLKYNSTPIESTDHLIQLTSKTPENLLVKLIYLRKKLQKKVTIKGGRIGVQIKSIVPDKLKSLAFQGDAAFNRADNELALKLFKEGLDISNATNKKNWKANFLNNLGVVYDRLSNYPKAMEYHQQALIIQRELGNPHGEAAGLNNLGNIYETLSQYSKAVEHFQQALTIQRELGNRAGEAEILNNLGNVYYRLSKYPKALDYLQQSLDIKHTLGNRDGEASSFNNLGLVYQGLGQYQKSLKFHQQALAIRRELGNRYDEVNSFNNLGIVYGILGKYKKALELHQQALIIQREFGNREGEANSLNNLGLVYEDISQYQKALEYHQQALAIQRELGNRAGEADTLNNLGNIYYLLSQYAKALEYYQQSVAIDRELEHRASEATSLANLGIVYETLSQYPKALEYLQQALKIQKEMKNQAGEASSLNHLGIVYFNLSQYQKALEYHQQSLKIKRELGDRPAEATSLGNLGNVYAKLSQFPKALDYFQQTLVIHRELGNRDHEATSLNNLGSVYNSLREYPKALGYYQQAIAIASQIEDYDGLWRAWKNIASVYSKLDQVNPAILAGKQAVNILQSIRSRNIALEKGLQKGFLIDKKFIYTDLADILIEQGRLLEAEQVMAMLKEEEYFDFIQRDGKEDPRSTIARYTAKEQSMVTELDNFHTQLASLGKEYETMIKTSQIDESAKVRLAEVEKILDKAQTDFIDLLSTLDEHFEKTSGKQALAHGERQLQQLESQQASLEKINAVIITTVVTEDKLHLLLTTPKVQLARHSPIGEKELNRLIERFRNALKHPESDPVPLAQELYKHLVKPLEEDLKQTQAKTLMWSLDGSLRYLPLAALHDGKQYLLERYASSLYTPAAHNNFNENNVEAWSVAGLGVSKEHPGFVALPSVPKELESIVRTDNNDKDGVIPGEIHLDKDFTRDSFKATLRKKYPVLHIASHFKLQPGDGSASKLLLGDGDTLTLNEFRRKAAFKLHGVDLMTLSACDTAVGGKTEGGEVESFAVMAQLRGAKGVMATLWKVEDESTGLLMQELYKLRSQNNQLSKAEALRQAQLKLLRKETDSKTGYNHPYFWAPFIMMGNWL